MYNFAEVEKKWKKYWEDNQTFKTDVWDFSKPKYYIVDMFPYPSGDGLHIGHPKGYVSTDVVSRFKRMRGYNVLHPMGFDSFGLPAEQNAIKTGIHPAILTSKNIANFTAQLKNLGLDFDWSRSVSTCDPKFYKWTQVIFELLHENGLTQYQDMPVFWCEELGTVLANDEIIDGKSERGGFPVVRKNMKQWTLAITKYAEELLNFDGLDWPNSTMEIQKNWIGRSEGAEVSFKIAGIDKSFDVFTTRQDTLFGATFCVLAPEHSLVAEIVTPAQKAEVENYVAECMRKSELERKELSTGKTGVFTGAYAINPVNGQQIPIYIADYILASYGTGAEMAVPAHDQRDFEFAQKFNLPIVEIVQGGDLSKEAYTGDGKHINSDFLDGLNNADANKKIIKFLEEKGLGKGTVKYRLRDWIFGRQRYWGEPIPVIHMEDGEVKLVPKNELPLELPELDNYKPSGGESALARAKAWLNVKIDGKKGRRETTTMPGSAGSSWYYMRYLDPHNDTEIAAKKLLEHWLPVDLYVGGAEHAVGHLLYSRFWNKFLCDKGYLSAREPFKKLRHVGMILAADGRKMSKRWGNVVNPDDLIKLHGLDILRLHQMFMGPMGEAVAWNESGIEGAKRFLEKVWRTIAESGKVSGEPNPKLERLYHQTVKKVTKDFEDITINTAVSQLMIFANAMQAAESVPKEYAEGFVKLLNPIAPCITEELWQILGHNESIAYQEWPTFDESKTKEDEFELVVQINGKVKDKVLANAGTETAELEKLALSLPKITALLADKKIIKVVVVKNKLVNIVIAG